MKNILKVELEVTIQDKIPNRERALKEIRDILNGLEIYFDEHPDNCNLDKLAIAKVKNIQYKH